MMDFSKDLKTITRNLHFFIENKLHEGKLEGGYENLHSQIGIAHGTFFKILKGKGTFDLSTLIKICQFLEIHPSAVFITKENLENLSQIKLPAYFQNLKLDDNSLKRLNIYRDHSKTKNQRKGYHKLVSKKINQLITDHHQKMNKIQARISNGRMNLFEEKIEDARLYLINNSNYAILYGAFGFDIWPTNEGLRAGIHLGEILASSSQE